MHGNAATEGSLRPGMAVNLHSPALEQSNDFRIIAVCDIEPERCDLAEQRLTCHTYADYHDMLAVIEFFSYVG
jgi:predicted dehydrogenase